VLPTPPLSRDSPRHGAVQKRGATSSRQQREAKRARMVAKARFGNSGLVTDGTGVERAEFLMRDPFPASRGAVRGQEAGDEEETADEQPLDRRRSKVDAVLRQARADVDAIDDEEDASRWTPAVKVTFVGSHVFAGIRQLVEAGIVDGERMPGWMTGEAGVTTGVIRHGRIRGHKGAGL